MTRSTLALRARTAAAAGLLLGALAPVLAVSHAGAQTQDFTADGEEAVRLLGSQIISLFVFPAVWIFIFYNLSWFRFIFEGN